VFIELLLYDTDPTTLLLGVDKDIFNMRLCTKTEVCRSKRWKVRHTQTCFLFYWPWPDELDIQKWRSYSEDVEKLCHMTLWLLQLCAAAGHVSSVFGIRCHVTQAKSN